MKISPQTVERKKKSHKLNGPVSERSLVRKVALYSARNVRLILIFARGYFIKGIPDPVP